MKSGSFMIIISGEIDYSEIFFKDNPPLQWGDKWDQGHEMVPFPVITYGMFLIFLVFVSIVAINVLVGLTVDDIRNFLENADLRKLTMRQPITITITITISITMALTITIIIMFIQA